MRHKTTIRILRRLGVYALNAGRPRLRRRSCVAAAVRRRNQRYPVATDAAAAAATDAAFIGGHASAVRGTS